MDKPTTSVSTLQGIETDADVSRAAAAAPFSVSEKKHTQQPRLWRNASSIAWLLTSFLACVLFSFLYCLFIYHVLIRKQPRVGGVLFDAPTSNLLISIFSQFFAILSDSMICGLLDTLRAALASREGGTSASAFFGISAATSWLSVFRLASVNGFGDLWCNIRLILPVLGLLFGSLLKFQATFDYYFSPNEVSTPVYAGLVPIEIRLLRMIRTADLWVYFQSFTSILLSHPRYAVPFPTDYCSGSNCISVLLPGGLEMVRQVSPALNLTVFNGGIFDKTEAIRVEASRGMALAFERVSPDFSFDWSKDCIYPGAQLDDGVQLCVQQSGNAIIAGWTSCPQAIFDSKQCTTKRNQWAGKPMDWTTKLTARFQSVTVTYDRNNGSIVDAKAVFSSPSPSSPSPQSSSREENIIPLSAADYLTLFKQILIPPPPESNRTLEITKINSITYDLTWLHRTYQVSFPDQKDTPLSYLRNFLAVPLQFGVVATAFANYSTDPLTLGFILGGKTLPLPEEMRTVAIGGRSTSLLVIRAWTGWTFIAGTAGMLAACVGGIGWLMMRRVRVFGTTGIPELDILRVAGQPLPPPPPPPAPCCSLNPFNSPHSPHFLNSPHTLNSPNSLHALNSPRGYTHMQREMSEEMMMTSPRRIFTGLSDIRSQKDGNTRISGWRLAAALRHWEVQSVARQDRDGNGEALIVAVPRDRGRAGRGEII